MNLKPTLKNRPRESPGKFVFSDAILVLACAVLVACGTNKREVPSLTPEPDEEKLRAEFQQGMTSLRSRVSTPLLWRFDGPGDSPTYLYGTVHYGIAPEQLPPALLHLFDSARNIVFENDMGISKTQDFGSSQDDNLGISPGQISKTALDKELPGHLWKRLTEGRTPEQIELLRTASAFIAAGAHSQRFVGSRDLRGVDLILLDRALLACKLPTGLEDASSLKVFEEFTVAHLIYEMEHIEEVLHWIPKLLASWLAGDEVGLNQLLLDFPSARPLPRYGLEKRNSAFLPQVAKYIDEGGAFIAVGSAHLIGPLGIIQSLREGGTSERD